MTVWGGREWRFRGAMLFAVWMELKAGMVAVEIGIFKAEMGIFAVEF